MPVDERHRARRAGRRLVRAPPVLRRRVRGRRGLAEDGQAGQADVAPHRQLPPGPRRTRCAPRACGSRTPAATSSPSTSGTPASRPTSRMGFGEMLTATLATLPGANSLGYSRDDLQAHPERAVQLRRRSRSCSTRSTRTTRSTPAACATSTAPNVCTATELMVDQLAKAMGQDPLQVPPRVRARRRLLAVLDKVAQVGNWGRTMAAGHGAGDRDPHRVQGPRPRAWSRSTARPATVNRQIDGRLHRPAGDQGRVRGRRRPADQPARARGADDGRDRWTGSRRR